MDIFATLPADEREVYFQQAAADLGMPAHVVENAMIDGGIGERAAADENLLAKVVAHKVAFYAAKWASYETAVGGTLRLLPPENRFREIGRDLDSMREMFFDTPPTIEAVIETLRTWETEFNQKR